MRQIQNKEVFLLQKSTGNVINDLNGIVESLNEVNVKLEGFKYEAPSRHAINALEDILHKQIAIIESATRHLTAKVAE